jgi:RNA polymerase sigma-70 factor (ECF subfamily)
MVDEGRFEEVYAAYGPAVLRYCAYSAGSRQIAEDLAAETFARFLERGDRVPAERTEAWLIQVARNLCASHHRSVSRSRLLHARAAHADPVADGWADPDAWRYVRRLKEPERLAVYLRVVEERPFAEVARLLGKSEGAAKMTFYRAVERLRADMERDGLGPSTSLVGGAEHV